MWMAVVVGVVVFVGVMAAVGAYNGMVRRRNAVERSLGTVDVQLRQRCDLIPNAVAAVSGYLSHERATLERLTELRAAAMAPSASAAQRIDLDQQMSGLLGRLVVQAEAYPDLKASANFVDLQHTLNEVEAQLAAARRTYNASVTDYNTAIESVPNNLFAGVFGFSRREVFAAAEAERARPDVGALLGGRG